MGFMDILSQLCEKFLEFPSRPNDVMLMPLYK